MIVLGLTGSVGMGKSTASKLFSDEGIPVYDADAAVHALYKGAAAPLIEEAFPGTTRDGEVDRAVLSRMVFGNPDALKKLEAIVHPLVREMETSFVAAAREADVPLVVLDIPLLFENGGEQRCDLVAVVSAPPDIQRERVMRREGMTEDKFAAILKRQVPDAEKRARADIVIDTSGPLENTRHTVKDIIARFTSPPAV
jgi:dephospho-CoA kinase